MEKRKIKPKSLKTRQNLKIKPYIPLEEQREYRRAKHQNNSSKTPSPSPRWKNQGRKHQKTRIRGKPKARQFGKKRHQTTPRGTKKPSQERKSHILRRNVQQIPGCQVLTYRGGGTRCNLKATKLGQKGKRHTERRHPKYSIRVSNACIVWSRPTYEQKPSSRDKTESIIETRISTENSEERRRPRTGEIRFYDPSLSSSPGSNLRGVRPPDETSRLKTLPLKKAMPEFGNYQENFSQRVGKETFLHRRKNEQCGGRKTAHCGSWRFKPDYGATTAPKHTYIFMKTNQLAAPEVEECSNGRAVSIRG